ncbi:MAG TPA: hypothetical protein VMH77_07330 [Steroidobacteraceae bacterium]|nr:hypothetical protein [Steroidobacteraceae bacterium]
MSKSFLSALAVTLMAVGVFHGAPACAQAPKPPSLSPALSKTWHAAVDARSAGRWPEVIAKAQEVLAFANRKPDDTYFAYALMYQAHHALGNDVEERKDLQGQIDSGFLAPAQQVPLIKAQMGLAFQAKDYQAAADFGLKLTKSNNGDPQVFTTIGESYFLMNNFAEAARFFKSLISTQVERGQTPLEQNVVMLQAANEKLGNKEGATDALETLVVYYPKPQYWEALLYSVRGIATLQQHQRLFVYRLMWATGTLKLRQDYDAFANLAASSNLPAETVSVYEAGLRAGAYTDTEKSTAQRRMESTAKVADAARATLPKLEADAAAAPAGDKAVSLGMILYSYGEPEKAVAQLQQGIAKGGLQGDMQVEARLMLGMAQLRARDKAGAQKTFAGIKSGDANWQRIAKFWGLYAK